MKILIKEGRILDPVSRRDGIYDLLIEEGKIKQVGKHLKDREAEIINAAGCYVMPGFVDLHVHLREPGYEYKETIATGGQAAARGGFTTICAMPNTNPVIDTGEKAALVQEKAALESPVQVYQLGAITIGQAGVELADIAGMEKAGVKAISEDGKSVMDEALYREAMEMAAKYDIPVFAHCEDINLVSGGVMNQDDKSEQLNLPGISNEVEDVIVERDIILAGETKARLHLCHCSTKGSVELLRQAKAKGIKVTGEVCPHHFVLSTEDIKSDDGNYKMNPPLRQKEDVEALIQGLKEGILDAVATDHAPHSQEEKNVSMKKASFGIVGLETAAALTYTALVATGVLTPMEMAEKMSKNPAQILKINRGSLEAGHVADIVIFDPAASYKIDAATFASKGKNTPFHGSTVKGKVRATMVDGTFVYRDEI